MLGIPQIGGATTDDETLITMDEAAKVLHVHLWTVRRLVGRGELPAVRIGRSVRIRPSDLRALIDQHVITADSPTSAAG